MSQDRPKEIDAYTQNVMSSIDPDAFRTLNLVQLEAIRSAISANAPFRKHGLDIRGVIPLFFARYYFVFLMGKDRRLSTREKEAQRLRFARGMSIVFVFYCVLACAIPVGLLLLYLLKSLLGIDLFPDQHLWDFF